MDRSLDAFEYKLLLDPQRIDVASETSARAFLTSLVAPMFALLPGVEARPERAPRAVVRDVQFFDTPDRHLVRSGFLLRSRRDAGGSPGAADVSIKFRTPHVALVSAVALDPDDPKAKRKLEADIGPSAVMASAADRPTGRPTADRVIYADPPSLVVRYAKSVRQTAEAPATVGDLERLFPSLKVDLVRAGSDRPLPAASLALLAGPLITEIVVAGPTVLFAHGAEINCVTTHWSYDEGKAAEVSFRLKQDKRQTSPHDLRLCDQVFAALQVALRDGLEATKLSKTAPVQPGV